MSPSTLQEACAQPGLYGLQHAGPEPDIESFTGLAESWKSRRILATGCGNGRVTPPLASAAVAWSGTVTGLDIEPGMLAAAREKDEAQQVQWVEGYLNQRRSEIPFDLIISPCGSPGHMLEIGQQLECWRTVHHNLTVEVASCSASRWPPAVKQFS